MRRWVSVVLLFLLFVPLISLGSASSAEAAEIPAAEQVPATQERVAVPEPSEEAMEYYHSGNVLWIVQQLWGLLLPFALVWYGVSAKLRTWVSRVARGRWYLTIAGFWLVYMGLTWLLSLPLAYYAEFARPHAYGLSEQAFGKWMQDAVIGLVLGGVFGCIFAWIPFAIIKRSPNRWWIYTSLVAIPLVFASMFIIPVFVSPLFNDFGPLSDPNLEAQILALADRAGIEGGRVYEVNKSVDTNMVNAYVNGMGSTKRIVLWDTLLAQFEPRETLLVMGHEMGHFVLGHMRMFMGMAVVAIPMTLGLVHIGAKRFLARYGERVGFTSLCDVAALPLMGVIMAVVGFCSAPVMNAVGRTAEHEADRFALEITHDNQACGKAFLKLQQQNLGNPRPGLLHKLWRASHPPLGERIDFCNDYRPWETGEEQRYTDLFNEDGDRV